MSQRCRKCGTRLNKFPIHCCNIVYQFSGDHGTGDADWPVYDGPCIHQGDVTRTELCRECKAEVKIKIFACELHGECTLKAGIGVKCCRCCADYERRA
jgi:hypothetical protein